MLWDLLVQLEHIDKNFRHRAVQLGGDLAAQVYVGIEGPGQGDVLHHRDLGLLRNPDDAQGQLD